MKHTVTIENTGETFRCDEDANVLLGMEQLCRKGDSGRLPQRRLRRLQSSSQ